MSRRHTHLNARRWDAVRRTVFERDGWRCRKCGRAGRLEVDHVVPLKRGRRSVGATNLVIVTDRRAYHLELTSTPETYMGLGLRPTSPSVSAWRPARRASRSASPPPPRWFMS